MWGTSYPGIKGGIFFQRPLWWFWFYWFHFFMKGVGDSRSPSLIMFMTNIFNSCKKRLKRLPSFTSILGNFSYTLFAIHILNGSAIVKCNGPEKVYLTLINTPMATKVVCFSCLLKCLRSLYGKQCGPRLDCSSCFYT